MTDFARPYEPSPNTIERNSRRARGWLLAWVASAMFFVPLTLLIFGACATPVHATPNEETQLPANGVLSIERDGDVWTVTTSSAPSEVKVMDPDLGPLCGTNYASLGPCATVTTFTADVACVYIQVDGIAGQNSSDPYVCRTTVTPTEPPVETTPPTTQPPVETTPPTLPPTESTPTPTEQPVTPSTTPAPAPSSAEPISGPQAGAERLAETGVGERFARAGVLVALALVALGGLLFALWLHKPRG